VIVIAELDYTKKMTYVKIIQGKKTEEIVLNGAQQYLQPQLSPKGDKLAFIYDKKALPAGLNSLYNLWTLDMKPQRLKQLTKDIKWVMFKWLNNNVIIGIKNYGPFNQLYLFDTKESKLMQFTNYDFSIQDFDIIDEWIVCIGNDVFGKIHTKVFSIRQSPPSMNVINSDIKRYKHISWNGTYENMVGLLILPPNYKPSKKYKLIVDVHGGGPGSSVFLTGSILRYCSQEWFYLSELFNCLIFVPEFRSSGVYDESVFSKDFIRGSVDDINSGVDYLIKRQMVNKNKMVVIGGSYGALISNFIPIVTNRFLSIISVEGWIKYDLPIDPLTQNLSTPMFFIQGNPKLGGHEIEDDIKTLHKKLTSSGINSKYLFIHNEGHVFYKRKNIQKIFDHVVDWLKIYFT
jgi:alpha/beta superfamily hydrolase